MLQRGAGKNKFNKKVWITPCRALLCVMCRIYSRVFSEMEIAPWCLWVTCPCDISYISVSTLWRRNSSCFFPSCKVTLFWGCFRSMRNVPVSTLKFVPFKVLLQPFGASVAEEYPLTVKTTVLVSVGSTCFSYTLYIIMSLLSKASRKWPLTVWLFSSACLIAFAKISWQQ